MGDTDEHNKPDEKEKLVADENKLITVKADDAEACRLLTIVKKSLGNPPKLQGKYRLVTESGALNWSIMAVRFSVLADNVSTTILQPNFPFIAREGAFDDSFESTAPFGFSAATYFLPMTALLASAITSSLIGNLSDKIGRRPCMLICVGMSVLGTIFKWVARKSFWGFCAANFANGLFGATVPVAIAYASDVHVNRHKKDAEIGILIGFSMIGMSGGGIAAILMEETGLFSPLFVGAALNLVSFVFSYFFLLEPDTNIRFDEEVDDDDEEPPEKVHTSVLLNVIFGALFDNVGSSGLYPLTLAPLAFETFYTDFLNPDGSGNPIMTANAYKWIAVMVAMMVIPGAALSQPLFDKIGPAGGCVFGNLVTAVGIVACLYICLIEPPSRGSLIGYVVFMYSIFPLTVVSQLSTGPMLDRLAPENRRGLIQGLNITVMNVSNAVAPWILGTISDSAGIEVTLWITVGISILAAAVNFPLTWTKELKKKSKADYQKAMDLEDEELVERALRGEYVPAEFLSNLNEARLRAGLPFLVPPIGKFEEDKKNMEDMKKHYKRDFVFFRTRVYQYLAELAAPDKKTEVVALLKKSSPSKETQDKSAVEFGTWFAEYLKDGGYFLDGGNPIVMKQIVMKAFPVLNNDHEYTEENVEQGLVRFLTLINTHLHEEEVATPTKAFRRSVLI